MNPKVKSSFENLLSNLKRLKETKAKIYEQRVTLYKELMAGGNGGILPDGSEFRSLHFQDWSNGNFAQLLFELNEIESIPHDLIENENLETENVEDNNAVSSVTLEAEVKKGWFSKIFGR